MFLRSLSSVPLTCLATSRYRDSSICFVQLVSLLMLLLFQGAVALLFLSYRVLATFSSVIWTEGKQMSGESTADIMCMGCE